MAQQQRETDPQLIPPNLEKLMENFVGQEFNVVVETLTTLAILDPNEEHSQERAEAAMACATKVRDTVLNAKNTCPMPETIRIYEDVQKIYNHLTRVMETKFNINQH